MKLTDEQLVKIRNILIILLSVSLLFTAVASVAFIKTKETDSDKGYTKSEKKSSTTMSDTTTDEVSTEESTSERETVVTNPPPSISEVKPNEDGIVIPDTINLQGTTVYLTFDDGPNAYTPKILDVLDAYGVKATFFVMNNGNYNHYMKDIVNRGHQIGLHTYSHKYASVYASDDAYYDDLGKISAIVKEQTGVDTRLIRFPGGTSNTVSKSYCKGIMTRLTTSTAQKGYFYFDWNATNGDAAGASGAKTISDQLAFCKRETRAGATQVVVLMHDKDLTARSLPYIIEWYQACGAKFAVLTPEVVVHHNPLN